MNETAGGSRRRRGGHRGNRSTLERKPVGIRLVVVGLLALVVGACSSSGGQASPAPVSVGSKLLPIPAAPPPGVTGLTVSPPDLGVSFSVPSGWVNEGPTASGFQDSYRNPAQPGLFVLTATQPAYATTAPAIATSRTAQFQRLRLRATTTMSSVETGTVDGLPAAEFRYRISIPNYPTAQDLEYDILVGSKVALVVIGTSPTHPETQLVNWVTAATPNSP